MLTRREAEFRRDLGSPSAHPVGPLPEWRVIRPESVNAGRLQGSNFRERRLPGSPEARRVRVADEFRARCQALQILMGLAQV